MSDPPYRVLRLPEMSQENYLKLSKDISDLIEAVKAAERARCAALVAALIEVVESLVPRYNPDYPEDHGFSPATAEIIRAAFDGR